VNAWLLQCFAEEFPPHCVTISKPFALAKYEVTQSQYLAVMGTNPSRFKDESSGIGLLRKKFGVGNHLECLHIGRLASHPHCVAQVHHW